MTTPNQSQFNQIGLVLPSGAPQTIVAAATIAPESGYSKVTGTTQVTTITPPLPNNVHVLFITAGATNSFALTTGNIVGGVTTSGTTVPSVLLYDPAQAKYLVVP